LTEGLFYFAHFACSASWRVWRLPGPNTKLRVWQEAVQPREEFLTLWKDADLDIPILKQAKAEYAKLQ